MTTYCHVYGSSSEGYIQFDMGAEKQVQTLYIAQGHHMGSREIDVWEVYIFSNTPAAASVTNHRGNGNHCFTGYLEGFKACTKSITGRYIVIPVTSTDLRISELLAYDATLIDVTYDRCINM